MTGLPPCACGHLECLHVPGGGSCTAGCDCRGYVRRTRLADEVPGIDPYAGLGLRCVHHSDGSIDTYGPGGSAEADHG
jgi:hypothetical protein